MMEQYKYEPLYGLQKPFDNGPADSTAYGLFRDGDEHIYYKIDKTSVYCFDTDNQWSHIDGAPTIPFLAMRRIIPEPKRWTVEDQKAGRLPEVGWVVTTNDTKRYVFVGESCHENQWSIRDAESGKVYHTPITWVLPLETPEEKAQRLRSEWIGKAYVDFHRLGCELEVLQKEQIKLIYDALLSGELPVPGKGE